MLAVNLSWPNGTKLRPHFSVQLPKEFVDAICSQGVLQLRSDSRTIYSLVFYCTKFLLNAIFHSEGWYVKLVNSVKC